MKAERAQRKNKTPALAGDKNETPKRAPSEEVEEQDREADSQGFWSGADRR